MLLRLWHAKGSLPDWLERTSKKWRTASSASVLPVCIPHNRRKKDLTKERERESTRELPDLRPARTGPVCLLLFCLPLVVQQSALAHRPFVGRPLH